MSTSVRTLFVKSSVFNVLITSETFEMLFSWAIILDNFGNFKEFSSLTLRLIIAFWLTVMVLRVLL